MGISSDDDVRLSDIMAWAQEQSVFLPHASDCLLLWYLCVNAFRHAGNREGKAVGDVLGAYTNFTRIMRNTGMSERTVRRSLGVLQTNGYILADMKQGFGQSTISVFWNEGADERRADARGGVRPLPEAFTRGQKKENTRHLEIVRDNIVQFPNRP